MEKWRVVSRSDKTCFNEPFWNDCSEPDRKTISLPFNFRLVAAEGCGRIARVTTAPSLRRVGARVTTRSRRGERAVATARNRQHALRAFLIV